MFPTPFQFSPWMQNLSSYARILTAADSFPVFCFGFFFLKEVSQFSIEMKKLTACFLLGYFVITNIAEVFFSTFFPIITPQTLLVSVGEASSTDWGVNVHHHYVSIFEYTFCINYNEIHVCLK